MESVVRELVQTPSCKAWIHKRCSDIRDILTQVHQYHCVKCASGEDPVGVSEMPRQISLGDGQDQSIFVGYIITSSYTLVLTVLK